MSLSFLKLFSYRYVHADCDKASLLSSTDKYACLTCREKPTGDKQPNENNYNRSVIIISFF